MEVWLQYQFIGPNLVDRLGYALCLYNVYKLYCYFELEEVCRNKVIMEKLKVSQNDARLQGKLKLR